MPWWIPPEHQWSLPVTFRSPVCSYKLTGRTLVHETTHTEAAWLLLEALLLLPLQERQNRYEIKEKERQRGEGCSKRINAVCDLTSEVNPLYAGLSEVPVWRHCSALKGLWEKKNKQERYTMDADKQPLNKALGNCKTTGKLISCKHPISCLQ